MLLIAFALSSLAGCSASQPFIWYSEVPKAPPSPLRTEIRSGDTLLVEVKDHPELSGQFVVGAAGSYMHPLAGLINVGGEDSLAAATTIRDALTQFVDQPNVSVTLVAYSPLNITIVGEVRSPGTFQLPFGSGVLQAIGSAGGLSEFASKDDIYVVRSRPTGMRIRFRYDDLILPVPAAANFRLQDGDTLLVE